MELTFKEESGSASFGTKVMPSLNGVDPSFINSVAGSYLLSQVAEISYMIDLRTFIYRSVKCFLNKSKCTIVLIIVRHAMRSYQQLKCTIKSYHTSAFHRNVKNSGLN